MEKEIQINIFNETGALQDCRFVNKENLIYYLENTFKDITNINIVRQYKKHQQEETSNPLSYPQECTTIEKQNIEGSIDIIEFCPFNVQTRELTQKEKNLMQEDLKENECIVWSDNGGYQKMTIEETKNHTNFN